MRKFLATLFLGAIIAVLPLGAQTGIGIVAGYVGASVSEDPATTGVTWSTKTGFAAGISLTLVSSGSISFGAEGLYAMKGANATASGTTASEKINYIEVPVLLRYNLTSGKGPKFFLTAGGQYSTLMACTESITGQADVDCKATSQVATSDYGAVFGVGVTSGKITLSGRYELGMKNLNTDTSTGAHVIKNRAIEALISIHL